MSSEQRVIGTCAIISVGVGSINSVVKNGRPPSMRFLIGSGVAYLALTALAEGEPEVAKALAMAVATTVVLGQGDGVFSYINKYGEADTQRKSDKKVERQDNPQQGNRRSTQMADAYTNDRPDTIPAQPGIHATR